MGIAAGIMLAPQLGGGVYVLMLDPDHTGTSVPVLLVWLLLDRAPRRWYVPPAVTVLLAWALASVALAPICWVSIAVAMRRASLSVRLLRPGLIGAVAVAVCLVVVVVSMAITVASLRGPGGLAPTVENVLLGSCVVPFAAVVTGVGLISGRRGLRSDREASAAPPAPGPVEVGTRPPSS